MSTRSSIALLEEDGSVVSIYCHNDGYPSGVGETLQNHYNNEEKVKQLIRLGDLSSLGKHHEPQTEYAECNYDWRVSGKVKHSYDTPHKGVTTAYHRDRGEDLNIHHHESESEWEGAWMVSHLYIFKDGEWYCDGEPLTEVLKKETA